MCCFDSSLQPLDGLPYIPATAPAFKVVDVRFIMDRESILKASCIQCIPDGPVDNVWWVTIVGKDVQMQSSSSSNHRGEQMFVALLVRHQKIDFVFARCESVPSGVLPGAESRSEAFEKLIIQATYLLTKLATRVFALFPLSLLFHLALRMPSLSMINLTLSTTLSAGAVAGI